MRKIDKINAQKAKAQISNAFTPFTIDFSDIPPLSEDSPKAYLSNEWREKCIKLGNKPLLRGYQLELEKSDNIQRDFKCIASFYNITYYVNEWAKLLLELKETQLAQRVLEKAISIKTGSPATYEMLGSIYYENNEIDKIKLIFEQLDSIYVPGESRQRVLKYLKMNVPIGVFHKVAYVSILPSCTKPLTIFPVRILPYLWIPGILIPPFPEFPVIMQDLFSGTIMVPHGQNRKDICIFL